MNFIYSLPIRKYASWDASLTKHNPFQPTKKKKKKKKKRIWEGQLCTFGLNGSSINM